MRMYRKNKLCVGIGKKKLVGFAAIHDFLEMLRFNQHGERELLHGICL